MNKMTGHARQCLKCGRFHRSRYKIHQFCSSVCHVLYWRDEADKLEGDILLLQKNNPEADKTSAEQYERREKLLTERYERALSHLAETHKHEIENANAVKKEEMKILADRYEQRLAALLKTHNNFVRKHKLKSVLPKE
jgi:hypothetical protein